ncbi:hypothetical protein G7043_39855 [Lentzea sp. NEAU-D13]|uniref:Uncharacterized protein n=1 Tax=Lentzea alba TaxID=2714351 RepID=A0A7C9RYB3_9PSEU|nr:hypothetical protein [Lentzea alba]NGY65086.1 hypothetical protein [Lentzea alba]
MSHHVPLPTEAQVRAAIDTARAETGRTPSALALATRLGLANTTFRRNFPEVCAELASTPRADADTGAADAYTRLQEDNARLRCRNRELTEHLELAIATIQRLAIDNSRLHAALAEAQQVTRMPRAVPTRRD